MSSKNQDRSSSSSSSASNNSSCKLRRYCALRFWLIFALVPILSVFLYGVAAFYVSSRSFNTEDVRKVVNEARQLCPDVTRPTCRMSKRTELEMNRVYPSEYAIASLQQHKARNVFNECPAGHYLLPVSETNAGRGFFRQSLYVDPEDGCRLWELEPVSLWEAVRTSLFHNPYELYKMTSLNPDCSSAEIEVDTNAMLDSGAIEVSNQSRLGSFNYMDPWITPERHFLYDVLPCAVYAVSKQRETVPRQICSSSLSQQPEFMIDKILSS